ncbi:MAG: C4-dicarboxylate ABC transporter permease [Acidobacteria bacterium]|nr:MAG: C4-dicarboxylate ABC transporter permease [Acidobacteriota bacterium]PYQ84162.1 MAG: C4-dicarboxylate ABC transporter permease [Acidobacteriota bacterium]PYR13930.1 MAG: C4-dicarboxylate ABC transporter permease [Acidobacteriota bacterium]
MIRRLAIVEDLTGSLALLVMAVLPIAEIVSRRFFGRGIPASGPVVQHLTLWVGFLGAAIAAREGKLLALATGTFIPQGLWRRAADIVAAAFGACSAIVLAWGGWQMAAIEREAGTNIGAGIPTWIAQIVLPISFAIIAARLVWRTSSASLSGERSASGSAPASAEARSASEGGSLSGERASPWLDRSLAALGILAGILFIRAPSLIEGAPLPLGFAIIVAAAVAGTPLFAILGGTAAFLFMHEGTTPATILIETYSLSVSPTLPAIPLFTLAGFLLAEGRASERLLRVFRAWFGWIPGGTAVVCAVLCSFFTVFTGGSGVTILALGGVLFPALIKDGYRERFSLGLLTASGSLGLLLPPALPLILYAVVAQIPIEDIFIGGILPGILLTAMVAAWGVREGIVSGAGRYSFRAGEALASAWAAKWELAMPALVLVAMFSGLATAVEASALTALYALVVQAAIHRDLSLRRDLLRAFTECVTVIGGVLIILGVAVGLTNYLVGAQLPAKLLEWARGHITSRLMFLLVLNLFLLAVGWLMEIFAAIVVVVPLIVPLGAAFGIHPVHLGIIFIANLELGFLTPLVGLNIFLASYRFRRPILEVCAAALPMMGILGIGVLVITYVPWLTTGLLSWLGR